MTKLNEIYLCDVCGNMIEVLHAGSGKLACCNESMGKMEESTVDASREKHVPMAKRAEGSIHVKVGKATHPMEQGHYIEWIEVIADGSVLRTHLVPGQSPETTFRCTADTFKVWAYCNLHGLWVDEQGGH